MFRPPDPQNLKVVAGFSYRYLTANFRRFPSFVILGAQRGGTTSLYQWLSEHPDVDPAKRKEIHYFDKHYDKPKRWYRAHFPFKRRGRLTGEGSPYMLFHPLVPERAAKELPPDTKFIALLREPVSRAISQYWFMQKVGGIENEPLERALALEPERLAAVEASVLRGRFSLAHMQYSYISRGEYAAQLRRWFDAVGRDRILVLESEKLYNDCDGASQRVLDFLGLAPHDRPYPVTNQAERQECESPELRARLEAHFEPHNRELFELLGQKYWVDSRS